MHIAVIGSLRTSAFVAAAALLLPFTLAAGPARTPKAPPGPKQAAAQQQASAQQQATPRQQASAQQQDFPQPRTFLAKQIGLSDDEIERAAQGDVVTKELDTPVRDEMALFGIARIETPIDFYLKQFEDIETFERGDAVKAIKKLSEPPQLSDFDQLSLSDDDLKEIPGCHPGHCSIKIDEQTLERLQKEVDWSAPDAHDKANALIREIMLAQAQAYLRDGNSALPTYIDSKEPTSVARESSGLLEDSPYLPEYVPQLSAYLAGFPQVELQGATGFLYWSTNDIGLKPLTVLTQVVIYPWEEGNITDAVIAGKQLYADHYFHAALELRFLIRDSSRPDATGFYLITLDRSRSDGLTGLKGGLIGGTLRRRSREALQSYLEHSKARVESEYEKTQ
jgi:hypothetical protein